jgi:beta-lactamase superfamily II metal-dependent hydrolase
MGEEIKAVPERELFAQVDTWWAVKDYPPIRNCVRLIGVDTYSFNNQLFNSEFGCQTYVLDLDWRDLLYAPYPTPFWFPCAAHPDFDEGHGAWLRVTYETSSDTTSSYAYPAFEAADPTYLNVLNVEPVPGPSVAPVPFSPAPVTAFPAAEDVPYALTAFHVGQGMCAVMHGPSSGYVLDAGAGTPVSRRDYLAKRHEDGAPFVNELRPLVDGLARVSAILSHPDADHWRLLDWDEVILAKLQNIFLPAGQPALAFNAPRVKPKVSGLGDFVFSMNSRNQLDVRRSGPTRSDKNGECLVTVAHCERRKGLLPGDYVYDRMATDRNPDIVRFAHDSYDAVVVPHHGDEASAARIVRPSRSGRSEAFFSAGTHAGYGHPTTMSIESHERAGFRKISDREQRDIIARRLLP